MSEERDIDAAEYVLGTLPADERARFAERLAREPALREEVRAWQSRLAPLDASAGSETPRAEVWQRIERLTANAPGAASAAGSNVVQLKRRLAVWRGAALAAGALAAGLAVVTVLDRTSLPPGDESGRYVAVVNSNGEAPALIAEVDTKAGLIRIRSLNAEVPAGHSLELWHIAEGGTPRSLGTLEAGGAAKVFRGATTDGPVGGLIAVTVEAEGGSPTGAPTTPVVYSGELVPFE